MIGQAQSFAQHLDQLALRALLQEVNLDFKPGLVCPTRKGSHHDMDSATFHASACALQGYFAQCFLAGFEGKTFRDLQYLGLAAEGNMLKATAGVNTHKGAVFALGLLAAAAGIQQEAQGRVEPSTLGETVARHFGASILLAGIRAASNRDCQSSHGQRVKESHGVPGAREQAASGFPVLFHVTWPQLRQALSHGAGQEKARLHALINTIAHLPDTNLAHRGGLSGLAWAQDQARCFLAQGGVFQPEWQDRATQLCIAFETRWLSPGGSADMLACALFLESLALAGFSTGSSKMAASQ